MISLTYHEKEYLRCLGDFFELSYKSKSEGMVFGVLVLRALTPETGLGQNEIAELVGKSKATVSRILDSLVQNGFCAYNLLETELKPTNGMKQKKMGRAQRRYYFNSEFGEIAELKLEQQIEGVMAIKTDLKKIREDISTSDTNIHQGLFSSTDHLDSALDKWALAYQKMKEVFHNE
ncbi:MAG: helix-turn-helix domain-containing protein [Candidatus Hodarchaeales archaeon]